MLILGLACIFLLPLLPLGCASDWRKPKGEACNPESVFSCGGGRFCERYSDSKNGYCRELPKAPDIKLRLPFPRGVSMICAQGNLNINPSASHSTRQDRDACRFAFDFASAANELPRFVLASAAGVAYAYGGCETKDLMRQNVENCNNGFGNMVKIDHGSGYYTLYAHLAAIAVASGTAVVTGEIIGLEGNTGMAGGKHIHWSLHQGDASQQEVTPTVPMNQIFAKDSTSSAEVFSLIHWSKFTCGNQTFQGAHRYFSDNELHSTIKPVYGLPNE